MCKPLISVIVPVYNVENYLEKCIRSIQKQTYKNLQILLIDDGSNDGSSVACDIFAEQDARIQVIHQKNQGAATARKSGIEAAEGEYICFVDADDYIANDMIEKLHSRMKDYDLVSSGCHCQKPTGEWFERFDSYPEGSYEGEKALMYLYSNLLIYQSRFEDGFLPFLWNKMYRTSILKQVIPEINLNLVYAEDRDLLFRYVLKCKKICVTHQAYYYYCYRKDSAVNSKNERFLSNLNELYLSLKNAFQGHKQEHILMYQLQMFINSRLYYIPSWMGFLPEAQMMRYILPYSISEKKKDIVLYGAGKVGRDFHCQLFRREDMDEILWVDKSWNTFQEKGFTVENPRKIADIEYDWIILAVKDSEVAGSIRTELCELGVPEQKIIWQPPVIFYY